jgi:tetraacyldisaccharide 4'-kinase
MIEKDEKLKRALLWAPTKLYELGVRLRISAYETDYLKPERLGATVISVGNITVGGTGKTPLVEYIARYLRRESHSVAILTRGYGRASSGRLVLNNPRDASTASARIKDSASYRDYGDEPLMLARALPDVPIVIDKRRYEAGLWAERELGSEVLILDDGYQHLGLARDLNILLIDATDPFGGLDMAPMGRLREPLYGVRRADVVIITRADRPFDQGRTLAVIKYFCGEKIPVLYVSSPIAGLRHLESGETYDARQFVGWSAAVMCGIGNPHAFADNILQVGMNIVSESFFRDHHPFTQEDMDGVLSAARARGADLIVTTEKDAVRLEEIKQGEVPIYAAKIEIESDDEVRLKSLLLRTIITGRK